MKIVDPSGLYYCYYSISLHFMSCTPNDPKNPYFSSNEYTAGNNQSSSCKDCQNNPDHTDVQDHGPLPTGSYIIEQQKSRGQPT